MDEKHAPSPSPIQRSLSAVTYWSTNRLNFLLFDFFLKKKSRLDLWAK
jgi:hypothetical protein